MHLPSSRSVTVAVIFLAACSSATPGPATTATPAPAPPAVPQTCPGPSDGPSVVIDAVETAHRALAADAAAPLPPPCVVVALADLGSAVHDSAATHGLAIVAEHKRRAAEPHAELLGAEVALLAGLGRHADALRAYSLLATIDSAPPMAIVRVAIAAARHVADTTKLLAILTSAAERADAPAPLKREAAILQRLPAYVAAINQGRGYIRQNPRYAAGYPSLISNLGTLGLTDSVVTYVRRGLANGVTRTALESGLQAYIDAQLRHAFLYGSAYGWEAPIAGALRVDSALTTPATKFLVASLSTQAVGAELARMSAGELKPADCGRISALSLHLEMADSYMRSGGATFGAGQAAELDRAIGSARVRLEALRAGCAG